MAKRVEKHSLLAFVLFSACLAGAETIAPKFSENTSAFKADAGADFRIRQEYMHDIPGLPGAPGAMMPRRMKKDINHFRLRPRIWGRLDYENFGLYTRITDEFREHIVRNGVRREDRSYNFPDEVILDNLFFEGRGLFDGFLDFRVGRQDLFNGVGSVLGLDRLVQDGTCYDGSRSCYADMIRVTLHPTETAKLDLFTLYDNGRNLFRWGDRHSRGRPMNAIHPRDSPEMDEWGGGAVWNDVLFEKRLPYQLFVVNKSTTSFTSPSGFRHSRKHVTALGVHVSPHLTEWASLDIEGVKQVGYQSNGTQAGGWMGYGAAEIHPYGLRETNPSRSWYPYTRLSVTYLSGDKHRDGANDNDTSWDPMWARAPCDSEFMQYGTLYGLGWWSNMIYPKLTIGADLGKRHRFSAYSGPMFAAVQDHYGQADHTGGSLYKGWMSAARYDFPILLAPKNASGLHRFEIFGHIVAELFNTGDYFDSGRPSFFVRWEFTFRF